jgi:DNA-directed RNA polymerase specialized sigma24 family protein
MTASGLAKLLTRLDADPDRAAAEYDRLRRALVRFFDWNGATTPDECADAALDRLARRLGDGTPIESLHGYARGIAKLVLLEHRRQPVLLSLDTLTSLPIVQPPVLDDDQGLHDCFDQCLDAMPTEARSTVTTYYEGEQRAKIVNRQRLATSLGLSENALRSRIRRLRERLEQCVNGCVARRTEAM